MEQKIFYYEISPLAYTGATSLFTYYSEIKLEIESIVLIPIGKRESLGIVSSLCDRPDFATKSVLRVLDLPPLPSYLIELADWMAGYYASSLSAVWSTFLPSGLMKKRKDKSNSTPHVSEVMRPNEVLSAEQTKVIRDISDSDKTVHLIQGVTGSGKTRIYIELAIKALEMGRSIIVLVPEITLTPQIISQFEQVFGERVLSTHSKLTEAQRDVIWRKAVTSHQAGLPTVVVGPRSSLFLPLSNLGLIIVDESHETSYKQDQHPRYSVLTTAARLGQITKSQVIFGSATPSVAEVFLAKSGRIMRHYLTKRFNQITHSEAEIIDLRRKDEFIESKFITHTLFEAISKTFDEQRQSLLFINRRGSATSQICGDCGSVTTCPNCLLPLTFHADIMRMICHHCNYRKANAAICPKCNSSNLRLLGGGTKRIESEVVRLWPTARIARLDKDSASLSHLKSVYKGLRNREIDILIGTQMIAKGLDLPAIDTVGVISADTMLHLPDYTASERTFQLLSQVSGRAGRGDRIGRVYLQTYSPDHPAIIAAATGDFEGIISSELQDRELLRYPPFVYLLKLTVAEKSREIAIKEATKYALSLKRPGLEISGPAPAFIETQAGLYKWIMTVKSRNRPPLVDIAMNLPSNRWTADLDPSNLL